MDKPKLKKGDSVVIISGKDKGKNAKVLRVFPDREKIVVDGVAIKKIHRRPKKAGQKGEIISASSPIHISNAMLYCKHCGKGTRAGYQALDDGLPDGKAGKKIRICKKCKNEV